MKMSLMAVSSAAVRSDQDQVLTALAHIGAVENQLTLKVDRQVIGKRLPAATGADVRLLQVMPVVNMQGLLRRDAGDYLPDELAIARLLDEVGSQHLLTIDASAFKIEVLLAVLHHMRRVLFAANEWPGSIAVVVRDELLDDATALLTKAFYSTPARTSVKEAASYAYRLHRVASMAHIFNWSQGATEKAFTLKDRLSRFWMRLSGKDEVDLT